MERLVNFKDYFSRIRRQFILNNYYTNIIKGGKTIYASFIDWVFITMILGLFFLATTFNVTRNIILSLILTVFLIMIFLMIVGVWKGKSRLKRIKEINDELASSAIVDELHEFGDRAFKIYIKELLEKYYKTKLGICSNQIDLMGKINEDNYGIKCLKKTVDKKVNLRDIDNYLDEMESKKIEYGIIVTNTVYDDEVKEKVDYLLIDFDMIKEMLEKMAIYPTKVEVEEMIIAKSLHRKGEIKEKNSFFRNDKIYKFILLGIILYLVSRFTIYPRYYRIMATLSMGFGTFIGVHNLLRFLEEDFNT